ncbi:YHYH domain-containing protein [Caenimonas sedimenti]|uniref:YHYH domain-containing protein n=1 Tax=Caenimonas sedimenti TaxID=2596921 RepID=A0A562ZHH5_9BURK|nr:YHYH domain-containing protein [Caenimonas sedimenti]
MKRLLIAGLLHASGGVHAHGGGLNAEGCHTNKKTGQNQGQLPPGCYRGPRGGTYTITKSGRKNYSGC